jgi:hypothetical protein
MNDQERKRWLDHSHNVDIVVYALYTICAVVALLDLLSYKHHLHFGFEYWPGFYSIFGFAACVGLVLAAKQLRKVVKRDEDYYDR